MSRLLKTMSKNNTLLAGITAVSTALIIHAVHADDFNQRVYVVGGVGLTELEPEGSSTALSISDKSDAGGHLGLGLDVNRFLTFEGYAASLGSASVEFQGVDAGSVDYTVFGVSALGYLYNSRSGLGLFDRDIVGLNRREGASLYGRVGVGHMQNDSTRVAYRRDYPNHAVFGLGVEYGFSNGLAVRTELTSFDTDAQYLNVGLLKRFGDAGPVPASAAALPDTMPPIEPAPAMPIVAEPTILNAMQSPNIYFELDNAELSSEARLKLDEFADMVADNDRELLIEGHTDWLASEGYNMGLSILRAQAIADYLVGRGISRERMSTAGFGETRPISSNITEEGRALNRRAEIILR